MDEKSIAIVLAAGQGKRMKSKIQKQFLLIKEKPVLYYSLNCFEKSQYVDEIILVTQEECREYCQREIVDKYGFHKVTYIIAGGRERYDSVYQGLLAAEECDYVYIHDGARPFITEEILKRASDAVHQEGACVVAVPSKDTVKISDEHGAVVNTPDRSFVWSIQTPQAFSYSLIRTAYEEIRKMNMDGITDDSMVVEQTMDCKIQLVEGSYHNIKITTPEDIRLAEAILEEQM